MSSTPPIRRCSTTASNITMEACSPALLSHMQISLFSIQSTNHIGILRRCRFSRLFFMHVFHILTSACYSMQAALLFGNYFKAIDFSEGLIHYSLEATFVTSAVGCSAIVMTSSPLPFRSEFVHSFLGNVPMVIMSFLLWLAAAILSTQFLPGTMVAYAGIVPVTVEVLVNLIWKTWGQTSTTTEHVEVDSTFGGVIPLSISLITMIYVNFGRLEEHLHDRYIITAVFCLLSSITFGLMRLLFPFHAECTPAKRSICTMLAIGPSLVGFALILIENLRAHS